MRYLTLAAMTVAMIGCGESGPKLVPVSGTVTLNGKPLEGAEIVFTPDPASTEGQPAVDMTGPAGNYKAMTRGRSGVVPGKYKVVITKTPVVAAPSASAAFKDDPFMAQLSANGPDPVQAKKNDPASATIQADFEREVPPEGGPQDFDVKAAVK
jgi:hypothetical protein